MEHYEQFPCEITMDSFGQTCPDNWEEIASHLNSIISNWVDELTTSDEYGFNALDKSVLRERVDKLWESYCAGELPDAPTPVFS